MACPPGTQDDKLYSFYHHFPFTPHMKEHLLAKLRGSGAHALAVAALLLTSVAGHAQTYCTTGLGGGCGGNNITAVGISGTTLNATGLTCPGTSTDAYTAYPATGATTATLSSGVPYTLSTTLTGASIVSVWIDYNHNFLFEASEWTQVTTSSPTGTPVSVQLLVPASAVQGQTTMRIRSRSEGSANGAADACTQFFSGETKDFTVTIGAPAACPAVSGLALSGITSTGATVNFTPVAGVSSYTLTVTPNGGTATTQTVSTSPATLTGLTPSTAYTVRVVSNCGGANGSSAASVATFNTACVAAPYALVNNTTAYTQDFEATWLSLCGTREAPATNWRNLPVTGNNSWRREDDGTSAAWSSSGGAYTPTGSPLGTGTHSARFHSYDVNSRGTGQLDLSVNMAGTAGTPTLSFDYINTSGSDSLKVFVSTDGGLTFGATPVLTATTSTTFTNKTVTIASTSATTVIRFQATSDYGNDDMGIDNLRLAVVTATQNAALAATVNLYPNPAHQSFQLSVPTSLRAASASLSNTLGQVVQSRQLNLPAAGGTADFNVSSLAPGVYTLTLKSGTDLVVKRVVVE